MTYIIGEIGQNHNGSIEIAKLIIDAATKNIIEPLFKLNLKGIDAVKLTKRDLNFELSNTQMKQPYRGPHSFGKTYYEHRKKLELSDEEHFELYKYVKSKNIDFVETLCSPTCKTIFNLFMPDKLKVASRDLTNLPLIEMLAETKTPIILSTGMSGKKELDEALNIITRHHSSISILHCVSEYPTHPKNVNLNTISFLKKNYPEFKIGYSDHTIGISAPVSAVAMGSEIIEKHITLDRNMKGTDHSGSLGPDGMFRMVRDIRLIEMSLGKNDIFVSNDVHKSKIKLERSIASTRKLIKGDKIKENDLHLLSPGDGIKWTDRKLIIGKEVSQNIEKNEIIYLKDVR